MTYWEDSDARQDRNARYPMTECVASEDPREEENVPAQLSDQQLWLATDAGRGKLLFDASEKIDFAGRLPGIRHVVEHQHDRRRASRACRDWAVAAYKPDLERGDTLVVALQFNAAIDPIDDDTLRFPIDGSPYAEPSERPLPPISSFEAADQFRAALAAILPGLRTYTIHGNLEGGRMGYCEAAFSESLDGLEARGIEVGVEPTNAGSVPYPHPVRPRLLNPAKPVSEWRFEWRVIGPQSEEALWPYGMRDRAPYVARYVQRHGLDTAVTNVIRRIHPGIGLLAVDPAASQLPVSTTRVDPQTGLAVAGHGPQAQGATRLERCVAFQVYLANYAAIRGIEPPAPLRLFQGCGLSASDAIQVSRDYDRGTEDKVRLYSARPVAFHLDPTLFRIFSGVTPRQPPNRGILGIPERRPARPGLRLSARTGPGGDPAIRLTRER
jgi:hypothetical protein